ncbi:MAG: hypothetical protein H6741_34940 [Alphaproteobacteria bacterium]|nr:hypothetical protein [Alphaproteobacteria bacterium]
MRWLCLALLGLGCTDKADDSGPSDSEAAAFDLYAASTTGLALEVDYAEGAEPYTGRVGLSEDIWALFEVNIDALLQGQKQLDVPHELSEMQALGDLGAGPFDVEALLALAEEHRDTRSGGDTARLYAIWLAGHFADEDGEQDSVIGVSLGNTGVIAMFKPVIERLGAMDGARAFGEQTTLIHEVGHALGLVNNGLPLTAQHQDAEHGAHCTDNECVMYWANEGPSELGQFITRFVTTGDAVIFGADCLADAAAALE